MALAWLLLGAVIGVFNGLESETGSETFAMILGGMIVLPVPGMLLGLVGGDAKGSVGGAAAGLFGCWLADYGGAAPIEPQGMNVIILIGALWGATGFLFLRFLVWKYTTIFAAIRWLLRSAPVPSGRGFSPVTIFLHHARAFLLSGCTDNPAIFGRVYAGLDRLRHAHGSAQC